jgi:predicted dehydrogenase
MTTEKETKQKRKKGKVRYAVVGLGHIAQSAVLPAFKNAKKNSELVALVSDDQEKHEKLGAMYNARTYTYDEYENCLRSGNIDAVYIALPNNMHHDFTVRAAENGVHVLCEKPMAVTENECLDMIRIADENQVKLMIAYRLHFEETNLKAIEIVQSGEIGEARLFRSVFSMPVKEGDIRVQRELGGGTLYDIGIYCINAARYIFREEPTEVAAFLGNNADPRFKEVEEMVSAILRFPGDRHATFTSSFSTEKTASYQVVGTAGNLIVDPTYGYSGELKYQLTVNGKTQKKTFSKRDQFAAEILYFSDCVLNNIQPEPSGEEGLADIRIIRALYESANTGRPVQLPPFERTARPTLAQEIKQPAVKEPNLVNAQSPTGN